MSIEKRKLVSYDDKLINKKKKIDEKLQEVIEELSKVDKLDAKRFHDDFLVFLKKSAKGSLSVVYNPNLTPKRLQRNMSLFISRIEAIDFASLKEFNTIVDENNREVFEFVRIEMDSGDILTFDIDANNELSNNIDSKSSISNYIMTDEDEYESEDENMNDQAMEAIKYFMWSLSDFVVDFLVESCILSTTFRYNGKKIKEELDNKMNNKTIVRIFPDSILFGFVYHMATGIWNTEFHPNLLL
jgi:hypothetical protein